jgi:hypothetical protein
MRRTGKRRGASALPTFGVSARLGTTDDAGGDRPEEERDESAQEQAECRRAQADVTDCRKGECHGQRSARQRQKETRGWHAGKASHARDDLGKEREPS